MPAHKERYHFIVNPASAGGKGATLWKEIEQKLKARKVDFNCSFTREPGHAIDLAKSALAWGERHFVSVGGDGTHHEVINGLFTGDHTITREFSLSLFPCGSGNDYARYFNLDTNLDAAINRLFTYREKQVDVVALQCFHHGAERHLYLISIAGTGFTADVTKTANEHFKFLGGLCYVGAFIPQLLTFENVESTIKIDNKTFQTKSCMTVVANTAYFGNGMKIAPLASAEDGLLDVLIFREFSRLELVLNFPRVFSGTHLHHPKIELYHGREVEIISEPAQAVLADGEIVGYTPVQLSVIHNALTLRI